MAVNGDQSSAHQMVKEALLRAPDWDRIWLHAARISKEEGDEKETLRRICHFKALNPVWAGMLDDEFNFEDCQR
ncbi:MAG: hypothetical protein AB8F65_10765 [Woeseiaceae bacterium]